MVVINVTSKTVISITRQGIRYLDDHGKEQFIDFEICKNNRVDYLKRRNQLSDERAEEYRQKTVCVGDRGYDGAYPCIYFYTSPMTVFKFIPSNILFRIFDRKEFHRRFIRFTYRDIIHAGYNTAEVG